MKESWERSVLLGEAEQTKGKTVFIKIDEIEPNPYQPRRHFPAETIAELAQSIRTYGLLQPIIVRKSGRAYQLVVGERRLIACRRLGWKSISASVKEITDSAMATIALIENLQRENLNFIEEAQGYARLMKTFNLTQEVLAQRLGKSQSTIANKLRLLKLPEPVQKILVEQNLTERHARALLKLESESTQKKMLAEIVNRGLNVSQTEKRIESMMEPATPAGKITEQREVRDSRIFLNTIREAVKLIQDAGLSPEIEEREAPEYIEVTIRMYKAKPQRPH